MMFSHFLEGLAFFKAKQLEIVDEILAQLNISIRTFNRKVSFYLLLRRFPILFHCSLSFSAISERMSDIIERAKASRDFLTILSHPCARIQINNSVSLIEERDADENVVLDTEIEGDQTVLISEVSGDENDCDLSEEISAMSFDDAPNEPPKPKFVFVDRHGNVEE